MKHNRLHFIEANAPLPFLGAEFFIENFKAKISKTTADYEGIVVFLPTRYAANTLKKEIILKLLDKGVSNIIGLNICTYEDYLKGFFDTKRRISKIENYSIWLSIMLNCDFSLIDGLIPESQGVSRDEVLYIAKEIIFLQQKLYENLISIREASDKFIDSPDAKRWADLAFLEDLYNYKAEGFGKISQLENNLIAIEKASNSKLENLLVLGNPDITPALKYFINKLGENGKKVDIAVFAKEENKNLFDEFGVAKEIEYSNREIDIKEENIYITTSPRGEANLIKSLANSYGDNKIDALAIACEQKKNAKMNQEVLKEAKVKAISFEGNSLAKTKLFNFLEVIKAFAEDDSFENFLNLVRNYFVYGHIKSENAQLDDVLIQLDNIKEQTACKDINSIIELLKTDFDTSKIEDEKKVEKLKKLANTNRVIKKLISIFKNLDIDNLEEIILEFCGKTKEEKEREALNVFSTCLSSIFSINDNFDLSFNLKEVFIILFETLSSASSKIKIPEKSIILQDWMEIFWAKAPHLLLCDMNDGIVPLRDNNGLFLNDSIRKILDMKTQQKRQARDAYMLECLINSRASSSCKLSILLAQNTIKGEPLVPSRLLFQTNCDNIAKRVNFLFAECPPETSPSNQELDWKLQVQDKDFEGNYSVSKFNTFLNSPWLFYLVNVLKMNIVDTQKEELSHMDFGILYHELLENFGNSKLKDSEDAGEINEFLLKQLNFIVNRDFANKQRVQIKIQLEDLKTRLRHTALKQAEHRANGWEIIYVEKKFKNYKLADGIILNGTFDRIDYHSEHGYLMIDYKTKSSATANIVEESHRNNKGEWKNLQMPIYLEVFEHLNIKTDKQAELNCAYFCATKDEASTGFFYWKNAKDYLEEAKNKAIKIAEKVKNRGFFELKAPDEWDNFKSVFKLDFELLKENVKEK